MAVYTDVSDEELSDFLTRYDIGALVSCKGIAEGVENARQLELLRALKVEYGQGYHFGKPLDAEAAEAMIAARPVW